MQTLQREMVTVHGVEEPGAEMRLAAVNLQGSGAARIAIYGTGTWTTQHPWIEIGRQVVTSWPGSAYSWDAPRTEMCLTALPAAATAVTFGFTVEKKWQKARAPLAAAATYGPVRVATKVRQ